MDPVDQQAIEAANASVNNRICAGCRGALRHVSGNTYVCASTNLYPWVCRSCANGFHLDESSPTIHPRNCPHCGSDFIVDAHKS